MLDKLVLLVFLLALWAYLRSRRIAISKENLRTAIAHKRESLLEILKHHDLNDHHPRPVTMSLNLLKRSIPDQVAVMSYAELKKMDFEFDETIGDLDYITAYK